MNRERAAGALIVGVAAIALQACTVVSYDLKNKLEGSRSAQTACEVRYSINVESATYTNTFGTDKTDRKRLQRVLDQYVADTDAVLRQKGCRAFSTDKSDEATLEIRIVRFFYISARPQELLTGLTFGVIPSWSTREAQYAYLFTDKASGEPSLYKEALTNFLEHAGSSAPAEG